MFNKKHTTLIAMLFSCTACQHIAITPHQHQLSKNNAKSWLAGDHHIHSIYSVKWDKSVEPPSPIFAGDAHYSAAMNAQMAQHHGLSWMVTTDHGGPNHSKLNLEHAYPALLASRQALPQIIQFYGMELDTPGAKHSSLIIPHSHQESTQLFELEQQYARNEVYPADPSRDTETRMLEALATMKQQENQPIVIVNHPGRTATDLGKYTKVTPTELRNWHDTAPMVAIGMEGSPGHQASAINADGSQNISGLRGGYKAFPTMGGFDQMTAKLGGFWDSMLGEGRRWWITSSSDSHVHYTEGRTDFWPGEYAKTYIYSQKNYHDLLENLRAGHVFVTTGDLISELYVSVENISMDKNSLQNKQTKTAGIGDTLTVSHSNMVEVTIRFLDPETNNFHFENPRVNRVDLIVGEVGKKHHDKSVDSNPSTKVIKRFDQHDWQKNGKYKTMTYQFNHVSDDFYLRVRGTNTDELEPEKDPSGEDPWADLWFYSNPIFIDVSQ